MKTHKGKKFLIIFVVLVLVGLSGIYLYFAENELPRIALTPEVSAINGKTSLTLTFQDEKSGLSWARVELLQQGRRQVVLRKTMGKGVHNWKTSLQAGGQGLEDGPFRLRVLAGDRSWKNLFQGNEQLLEQKIILDTQAPRIRLETFRHNLNQGGSGLVGFSVSEEMDKGVVRIANDVFPVYETQEGLYFALFAVPYALGPDAIEPVIQVQDRAGNRKQIGFRFHLSRRQFPQTSIEISDQFLKSKMIHFQDAYPNLTNELDIFLKVNQDMRQANRKLLKQIGLNTVSEPLWSGRFLRQKGAKRSEFAAQRTYYYQGAEIDQQTHLGVDIASLARARVQAANSGRVVYSDWLGIYGQVVIIDHGLGLQTLYAHLSQRAVQKGDRVRKGQDIGRTGATGMAGGDHLHFSVLLSGYPVNPIEWWDANWVRNNIAGKLGLAE